jgi:hypothetical protein
MVVQNPEMSWKLLSTKSRKFVPTLLKVQSGAWPYMSGDCIALPAIL